MSFYFINNLGEKSKSYNNPYDAFESTVSFIYTCFVFDNRVINILDTKMISVKWAVSCAKRVLHIFEEKYPDDKRPRKAIEAVSDWIKDPSEKNKKICVNTSNIFYDLIGSDINNAAFAASFASCAVAYSYSAYYAGVAADDASNASSNKSSEIKWQRKKLNQIVYEEILVLLAKSQYQRIDKKLVRKIPKELLEYIGSFITG